MTTIVIKESLRNHKKPNSREFTTGYDFTKNLLRNYKKNSAEVKRNPILVLKQRRRAKS